MKMACDQDESLREGKPFYCDMHVDLAYVFVQDSPDRKPMIYLACPDCKKKVIDDGRGYQCESCNKCHEEAKPTHNFSFKVQDCSGSVLIQSIGEVGDAIIGLTASELYSMRDDFE